MKRTTLAVFEGDGTDGYSAFSPDFPGTGGLGDTLDETRQNLREGIGYLLEEDNGVRTRFVTNGPSGSVNFAEFDPDHTGHYVIEWLAIDVPVAAEAVAA